MPEPKLINPAPEVFLACLSWLMSRACCDRAARLPSLAELVLGHLHYGPLLSQDRFSNLHLIFEGTVCGEILWRNTRVGSNLFLLSAVSGKAACD